MEQEKDIQFCIITCPNCGFSKEEVMELNSCRYFYSCLQCGQILRPKEGDCCVFCSYGSKKCPPKLCCG